MCEDCNSDKRDRPPVEYYTLDELRRLSAIVGLPLDDLTKPVPNPYIVITLLANLDWFFDEFLSTAEMRRHHDGKVVGELLVKALQKAPGCCRGGAPVDLVAEYERRRQ